MCQGIATQRNARAETMCKIELIKAARLQLITAMRAHLPQDCSEVIDRIESDDKGHMLSWSLDNPLQVSYAANAAHTFDPVKRMRTSLGRYLSRQYGVEITPTINSAIERIFGDIAYDGQRFAVREDVYDVYSEVASSCMTEMDCVRFYEDNGVRVVTYTPPGEDKPIARALLWKTDKGEFLDRIYPNSGPHIEHYLKWAEDRGCDVRPHHRMGDVYIDHKIRNVRVGPMPYLDTFCYLSGTTLSARGGGLCCHSTEGLEPTECANCSEWCFDEENEGYCEDCNNNLYSCDRCGRRTEDTTEISGQTVCECCAEDSHCCDRCNEMVWETGHIDGQDVCESCADDACNCERCEERVFDVSQVDGQTVCESCAEDAEECERCNDTVFETSEIGDKTVCSACADDAKDCEECATTYLPDSPNLPIFRQGRDLCDCCQQSAAAPA